MTAPSGTRPGRGGGARRPSAASLAVLIATLACGTPPHADPDGRTLVRVAVRPFLTYAPLYIADERGHFAAEGIEVEFVTIGSSTQGIPLLLSGGLDVLPAPVTPGFLHAFQRGLGVKFVADKGWVDPEGCSFAALVGRVEPFERRSGSGLGGSVRVSLPRDTQMLFFVNRALEERFGYGVEDEAIEGFNIPDPAELTAFRDGALDAALMSGHHLLAALRIEGIESIAGIEDVLPGYQFSTITYGPRLLEEDPDLGRRFMVAYLRGVRSYLEGKTDENVAALVAATGLGEPELRDSCWMPVRRDGVADIETVFDYIDWYLERGWLDAAPDFEQMWDRSFVDFANEQLDGSVTLEDE